MARGFLKIHNDQTLYKFIHNNKETKIILKRNISFKNHLNNLIYKKYLNNDQGYFKFRSRGFNSLFLSYEVDLIFVNWDNITIEIYEGFSKNKFSNFHKNTKFCYILPTETIKKNSIIIGDKINHTRLSKKSTKKYNKIDESFN